jgi:hypothetical protein
MSRSRLIARLTNEDRRPDRFARDARVRFF